VMPRTPEELRAYAAVAYEREKFLAAVDPIGQHGDMVRELPGTENEK
jgi:hypothetical protein